MGRVTLLAASNMSSGATWGTSSGTSPGERAESGPRQAAPADCPRWSRPPEAPELVGWSSWFSERRTPSASTSDGSESCGRCAPQHQVISLLEGDINNSVTLTDGASGIANQQMRKMGGRHLALEGDTARARRASRNAQLV